MNGTQLPAKQASTEPKPTANELTAIALKTDLTEVALRFGKLKGWKRYYLVEASS